MSLFRCPNCHAQIYTISELAVCSRCMGIFAVKYLKMDNVPTLGKVFNMEVT